MKRYFLAALLSLACVAAANAAPPGVAELRARAALALAAAPVNSCPCAGLGGKGCPCDAGGPCRCGDYCSCGPFADGSGRPCPGRASSARKPKPPGEGWTWEPTEGGYWWRWKALAAPPPVMVPPFPAFGGFGGCSGGG